MEVTVISTATGESTCVSVSENETLGGLVRTAADEFGLDPAYVAAYAGDTDLCDHYGLDARLSDCTAVEAGCEVQLRPEASHYARDIANGNTAYADLPPWAKQTRECATAAIDRDPCIFGDIDPSLHNDKALVMHAISKGGSLRYASPDLQDDDEVVAAAFAQHPGHLQYATLRHRRSHPKVVAMLRADRTAIHSVHPDLLGDRTFAAEALDICNGRHYDRFDAGIRADPDLASFATLRWVYAFEHTAESLRADRAFVLKLFRDLAHKPRFWERSTPPTRFNHAADAPCPLSLVSEALRADRDIVLAAVLLRGDSLQYASRPLRGDPSLVLQGLEVSPSPLPYALPPAVESSKVMFRAMSIHSGEQLSHAGPGLLADKAFMLKAVKQGALAFPYAALELRADPAVALAAVKQDPSLYATLPEAARCDPDVLCATLAGRPDVDIPAQLLGNPAVMRRAVGISKHCIAKASPEVRDDVEVMLAAVRHNPYALKHAEATPRADRRVVLAAVSDKGSAIEFASPELQGDHEVARAALKQNPYALCSATHSKLSDDRSFILSAVSINGNALSGASERLRGDRAVVTAAVRSAGSALRYASSNLRADREVVVAAVGQDATALGHTTLPAAQHPGIVAQANGMASAVSRLFGLA